MATKQDFDLIKGETFSQRIVIRDSNYNYKDLTDYTVSGFCKYNYCNTGYLFDLNPSVFSAISGTIDIYVAYTGTTALPVTKLPYDLNIYTSGISENVLYGYVYVWPGVIGTTN